MEKMTAIPLRSCDGVIMKLHSTPRYMQAVRNRIQVARCDRPPPALVLDYRDSTPCSSNGGLSDSS